MTNFYDSLGINGGLSISANSNTDAIYISQLGGGNAMLIEDSSNPDLTPFIINSGGSVNIGRIEYLTTSSGTPAKLQVNNSASQIPSSGLPFTTNVIVQGFNNNNVGLFTTDSNTSQIYFGTPSSVYGAKLSWYYTGGTFDLSTQTTGGTITFGTDQGFERMRIGSDGKVGIGTTATTANLEVAGSISATTISGGTFYGKGSGLTGVGLPYKVYAVLLTQTGTANPVVTIVENTLGVITINRDSVGRYSVNSLGLFTSNKTIVYISTITSSAGPYGGYASISNNSQNTIYIDTTKVIGSGGGIPGTGTDNVLYNTSFEIRVYN